MFTSACASMAVGASTAGVASATTASSVCMGSSVASAAELAPSVIEEMEGTEGPGAGVDWVTVVMARPWLALGGLVPAAVVVEAASELLVPSAPSSVCWAGNKNPKPFVNVLKYRLYLSNLTQRQRK